MSIVTSPEIDPCELKVASHSPEGDQRKRILTALRLPHGRLPLVSDDMHFRYYKYLSEALSFPFTANYPEPTSPREEVLHRCEVLELIDPSKYISDDFSGIFCKTRKGNFEVNLPLVELEVPQNSPNFQLIEDYWYWFWNWR